MSRAPTSDFWFVRHSSILGRGCKRSRRFLPNNFTQRRHQYQLPVAEIRGPRSSFSEISHENLCDHVRQVLQLLAHAGETYVIGALRGRGIFVQIWRIREAIYNVDPVSRALRRERAVTRRSYNIPCPNALW